MFISSFNLEVASEAQQGNHIFTLITLDSSFDNKDYDNN